MWFHIRKAGPEHLPGIRTAHREAVLGLTREAYGQVQLEAWAAAMRPEAIQSALADPELTMLVALVGEAVAGFILFAPGEVRAMYVHPAHARQGLGRQLLTLAEDATRQAGLDVLRLSASGNAVPFYRASGFVGGEEDVFCLRGGITLTCLKMEKRLSPLR